MEGNDSHELRVQEKKAVEELSKLPESDRTVLSPVLDLQKQRNTLFLTFLSELRALEFKYDQLYLPLYTQRSEIITRTPEFWLKVIKNNPLTSTLVFEQDEQLLKHLVDIRHFSEENSDNFTLEFHFSENTFIENKVLTKRYIMGSDDEPKKGEGTEIQWKGTNLTQKVKKTKKRGKNKKAGIKIEEVPSFFSFFKTITDEDDEKDEHDEDEEEMGDTIEDDYEVACEFRDEIVPNAVYYYLGVRDEDNDEEDDSEEGEEGAKPKKKKVDGSGAEKADCKTQ
jgi:nucleosome assembly protein 1-like 1